jgi:hypothetical protein
MPQAREFLPLLTVGFGGLGLGSHQLLISSLTDIAKFLLKCGT